MELKVDPPKIKALRHGKSWSQEELAAKATVSLRTVQRMELDGSTSLKSRRAIADALEVDPAYLDIESEYHETRVQNQDPENAKPGKKKTDSWSSSLTYPGPSNFSNKVRTPLLIVLWIGMVISGAPLLIGILTVAAMSILNPDNSYTTMLLASVPLFIVFTIFLFLYQFFRKRSASSDA